MNTRRVPLVAGITLLGLALGACTNSPLYKPQASKSGSGYSEQQLDANQYRVTFTGKRSTSRQRVEDGLMLRAAEVTREAGFSHFLVNNRETEREGDWFGRDPWGWDYGPRFALSYGIGGGRYGFYDPFHYRFGFYHDRFDESRFVASADITMLTAAQASSEPSAIEAASVIANLGPLLAPPPPPG